MGIKQPGGYFKRQIGEISHEKTRIWIRKGNFKRGTGCLRIAAQNNVIRINYIIAKIDHTQYIS